MIFNKCGEWSLLGLSPAVFDFLWDLPFKRKEKTKYDSCAWSTRITPFKMHSWWGCSNRISFLYIRKSKLRFFLALNSWEMRWVVSFFVSLDSSTRTLEDWNKEVEKFYGYQWNLYIYIYSLMLNNFRFWSVENEKRYDQ